MYVQFKYAAKNEIRSLDHGYFYHGNVVAKGHFLVARDVKFYKMTFNPDCRSYVVSHQTHLGVIHSDVTKTNIYEPSHGKRYNNSLYKNVEKRSLK